MKQINLARKDAVLHLCWCK